MTSLGAFPLDDRWRETLSLSRRQAPEFYQANTPIEPGPHVDAIRFVLTDLGLAAVFCIDDVPTIGFLNEPNCTSERIDNVHRILWNQGLMSLLLVIRDDELVAYSLVKRPFVGQANSANDPRLVMTLSLLKDALKLRELIDSTESGRFWYENDSFFDPAQRVDSVLLDNLLHAFREIKDDLGADGGQALLMQTMFIAYLEDRGIVTPDAFKETSGGAYSSFQEVLAAKTTAPFENLFAWLKDAFNGYVFNAPCAFDGGNVAPAARLKAHHLRVLARFRHGREEMDSHQSRFWGYDFQYMPIALISAVYDRFLREEAEKKSLEGAFYTPMFLADVVVNQVWDELNDHQRASGVFCDPACGSGIFLVRIFQRLVGFHCRTKNKHHATWNELIAIAHRLHGGDINVSAVHVATFSLYIALLEHSNPPDLRALIKKGKLLPVLYGDTLRPAEDFMHASEGAHYDAVVGNPPWKGRAGQVTTAQRWTEQHALPVPAKDVAWGFIWKSLKVLKPDGVVGLLLPAMGVLHNTSAESQNARRRLMRIACIRRIVNLSDLCFQLFDGAQRPTAFVLYRLGSADDIPYYFEYWVPKADLNLRLKRLLTLARSDRTRLRSDHVEQDPSIFKRRLWTRSPDEKLLQYLRTTAPLAAMVRQFKDVGGSHNQLRRKSDWVIGQGFKPAQSNRINDDGYKTTASPVVTRYPYLAAEKFQSLALPRIRSAPWPDAIVHRAGFSEGFLGPHIIIPQGVERASGRLRAAYTKQSLVFEHSLQAIAFPPKECTTAKLLTAILNSRLAAWFYFHESANLGTDRAKVIQADILKLPFSTPKHMPESERATSAARKLVQLIDDQADRADDLLRPVDNVLDKVDTLVYAYYGLDDHDIILVEDSFKYMIPAMQPRRSAGLQAIWGNSKFEDREAYASILCDALKPWFDNPIDASLAAKSTDIAVLKLTLVKGRQEFPYSEHATPDVDRFLSEIATSLPCPMPGNFQVVPDLRFVIGDAMYLVKPTQLRFWLRSTALADAEQIAADFSATVARRDREVHDDRR